MRVTLYAASCVRGGVLTWMANMARGLCRAGHEPALFFSRAATGLEVAQAAPCVVVVGNAADLVRHCSATSVDVLHMNASAVPLMEQLRRRLPRGLRVVATSHGWSRPGWFSTNCHAYCGVSRDMCDWASRHTDLIPDLVLNGVDTSVFCPTQAEPRAGPPIIAWSGRAKSIGQKNIPLFLAAAQQLRASGARIWISDADGADPDDFGVTVGLGGLVERWDTVAYADMPGWYRAVAATGGCLVSTSNYEGLSMNSIEAQACGCPCVGPAVTGVVEAIDPRHGGDVYPVGISGADLAARIRHWVADRAAMEARGQAAAEWATAAFSAERMAREYVEVYERPGPRTTGGIRGPYLRWEYALEHKLARPLFRVARGRPWSNAAADAEPEAGGTRAPRVPRGRGKR